MKTTGLIKSFAATLLTVAAMASCERTHIDLGEQNIFTRLEAFIGENSKEVTRQMRQEGYRVVNFYENSTNYLDKNSNGQYAILFNTGDKTVYAASYFLSANFLDSTAFAENETKYAEWRTGAREKNCENYKGILSGNIVDLDSLYDEKNRINDSTVEYTYYDEAAFSLVYDMNKSMGSVMSASELWYNGETGTAEEYVIKYTNETLKNEVSIAVSDYSLRE